VGETSEATVVLQGAPLQGAELDHIEADSADLHVEATGAQGRSNARTFRVKMRAGKEGDTSSFVRFFLRAQGRELSAVRMEVLLYGQPKRVGSKKEKSS
jgi:hypothetical protein